MPEELERIRVFVSSKQDEFETERTVLAHTIRSVPLLTPVLANEWRPQRTDVRDRYVSDVRRSPIYVGLFGRVYSHPTRIEYDEAWSNPHREILIYLKRSRKVHKKLEQFIELLKARHVIFKYTDLNELLPVFVDHLYAAVSRMINRYQESLGPSRPLLGHAAASSLAQAYRDIGFPANISAETMRALATRVTGSRQPSEQID